MESGVLHSDCSYTQNKGILCEINEIKELWGMQNACVLTKIGEHIFVSVAI